MIIPYPAYFYEMGMKTVFIISICGALCHISMRWLNKPGMTHGKDTQSIK